MAFSLEEYQQLLRQLSAAAEPAYKRFNERLLPGVYHSYGVRVPILRKMAKKIAMSDWRAFLHTAQDTTQEELLLQALVIGIADCQVKEKIAYAGKFVAKINNWQVCDIFCSCLKIALQDKNQTAEWILQYLFSEKEFERRFAIVMLLNYFIAPEDIDATLARLAQVKDDRYYVNMALAWALSVCFVSFPQKTLEVLCSGALNAFVFDKTIQKICESNRVSKAEKQKVRMLRKQTAKAFAGGASARSK